MSTVLAVVDLGLMVATVAGASDQIPTPPFYALLPPDYPYPLIRVCYTQQGICAVPYYVVPGEPCSCVRPDSIRVSRVVTH